MPYVSVVIPAYNAANTIAETLKALRSQAGIADYEVVVVDNGSSDETARVARAYGARVLHEEIRGPAAARNKGLIDSNGEIVAHLDADTVPSRRWLAELCAPFADDRVVIAAGHSLCYPPKTGAERYAQSIGLNDATLAVLREPFPFAPSLNLAVRRGAAIAVGGWNVVLRTGEDVDFSHRILKRYGGPIVYCERAILYHHARSDDAALRRQAYTYGAGAADLYALYPDEVAWTAAKTLHVMRTLCARAIAPVAAGVGKAFGIVDAERLEFLRYHWIWTRSFWLGFAARKYFGSRI